MIPLIPVDSVRSRGLTWKLSLTCRKQDESNIHFKTKYLLKPHQVLCHVWNKVINKRKMICLFYFFHVLFFLKSFFKSKLKVLLTWSWLYVVSRLLQVAVLLTPILAGLYQFMLKSHGIGMVEKVALKSDIIPSHSFVCVGMPRHHPGSDMPNFYSLSPGGVGQITPPLGWWVSDKHKQKHAQLVHVNKEQSLCSFFTSDVLWHSLCAEQRTGGLQQQQQHRGGLPPAFPAALLWLQPHCFSVCPAHVKHITTYVPLHNHMAA